MESKESENNCIEAEKSTASARPDPLVTTFRRAKLAIQILACLIYFATIKDLSMIAAGAFAAVVLVHATLFILIASYRKKVFFLTTPGLKILTLMLFSAAVRTIKSLYFHPKYILWGFAGAALLAGVWVTGLIGPIILFLLDNFFFPYGRARFSKEREFDKTLLFHFAGDVDESAGTRPDWEACRGLGARRLIGRSDLEFSSTTFLREDVARKLSEILREARGELPEASIAVAMKFDSSNMGDVWVPGSVEAAREWIKNTGADGIALDWVKISDSSVPAWLGTISKIFAGKEIIVALRPEAVKFWKMLVKNVRKMPPEQRPAAFLVYSGAERVICARAYALKLRWKSGMMIRSLKRTGVRLMLQAPMGRSGGFSARSAANLENSLAALEKIFIASRAGLAVDITGWQKESWDRLWESFPDWEPVAGARAAAELAGAEIR